ncbi:ECF-type sigma factor [Planctomicrobium sp. SH527]|uniref:ECF-type sigma factor n=1 Tax=Planctomicrobium sp. SH527 TaxID=3448123 RepID=UPI003F5B657D
MQDAVNGLEDVDIAGSITCLYRKWRQGHVESLEKLVERFRPRLLALARSTLQGRVRRIADAEDALQGAIISFWEKAEDGSLSENMDRNDLWNVLGVITVRKALRIQERESAKKRGGDQHHVDQGVDWVPAPHQSESPELLCAEMLELLEKELQPYAILKLSGYSIREIAEEFDCTEKKIERKLKLIRTIWGQEISRWNS